MNFPSYTICIYYKELATYKECPYKVMPIVKLSNTNDNYLGKYKDNSLERKNYYGKKRRYYSDYI